VLMICDSGHILDIKLESADFTQDLIKGALARLLQHGSWHSRFRYTGL